MKRPFTRTVTLSITYNAVEYTTINGKPDIKVLDTFTLDDEITASEKRDRAKKLGSKTVQFIEAERKEELRSMSYEDFMKYSVPADKKDSAEEKKDSAAEEKNTAAKKSNN